MSRPSSSTVVSAVPSWGTHAAGTLGAVGFAGALAVGLSILCTQSAPVEAPADAEILSVEMPEPPPPPPPPTATRGAPLPPAPLILDSAPSVSTVRLAPTPVPLEPLMTEVRPTFSLRFDHSPGQFRPDTSTWEPDADHVFQQSEVDQRIVPIYRKVPEIPSSLIERIRDPRVRLLFVVNADGTVQNVRVLRGVDPEFDRLVAEAVAQWRFRPAMRKGKKVRCLAELPVFVRSPPASPFHVD